MHAAVLPRRPCSTASLKKPVWRPLLEFVFLLEFDLFSSTAKAPTQIVVRSDTLFVIRLRVDCLSTACSGDDFESCSCDGPPSGLWCLPGTMQEDLTGPSTSDPECYLIVHNVAKKHNIGTLARSATAFNVAKVRHSVPAPDCLLIRLKADAFCADLLGGITTLQYLRKSWFSCSHAPCIFCQSG